MLNISGIEPESFVDGEGIRYAIFVQGCKHACTGCHNPETWSFKENKLKSTEELLGEILADPLLDGITLSGGDPFYQAEGCIELIEQLRNKRPDMDIWAYTGFTWESIIKDANMRKMASLCDVVVDGPFIEKEKSLELLFRGSRNQRIIRAKDTIAAYAEGSLKEGKVLMVDMG